MPIAAVNCEPAAHRLHPATFFIFTVLQSKSEEKSLYSSVYCTAVRVRLSKWSGLIYLNDRSCTKFYRFVPNTMGYKNQQTMAKILQVFQGCGIVLSQSTKSTEIFELCQILDSVLVARRNSEMSGTAV